MRPLSNNTPKDQDDSDDEYWGQYGHHEPSSPLDRNPSSMTWLHSTGHGTMVHDDHQEEEDEEDKDDSDYWSKYEDPHDEEESESRQLESTRLKEQPGYDNDPRQDLTIYHLDHDSEKDMAGSSGVGSPSHSRRILASLPLPVSTQMTFPPTALEDKPVDPALLMALLQRLAYSSLNNQWTLDQDTKDAEQVLIQEDIEMTLDRSLVVGQGSVDHSRSRSQSRSSLEGRVLFSKDTEETDPTTYLATPPVSTFMPEPTLSL